MRTSANRFETSTSREVTYRSSSTLCCSARSLFSSRSHCKLRNTTSRDHTCNAFRTLRVTVHDVYIIPVPQANFLASATLPRTSLTSQKAASFLSSAVPRPCSRIFSPPVEQLACTAPMQHCTSSSLSPHGRRREPANLLATQLDVHDNGGGWLHYQASKFNSRRRPTLGHFVIECSAVTTPDWPAKKLEAGRRRKRLQNATDATRDMAARLHGRG